MADVQAADAQCVLECLEESGDIAALDPTFGPASAGEIGELIAKSQSGVCDKTRQFQMQMIRKTGTQTSVGYWHLMQVPTRERVVGISILLIRPNCRGQGLGRELILSAAAHLAPRYGELWSRVYLGNTRAMEFWAELGFDSLVKHQGRFVHAFDELPSIVIAKKLHAASRDGTQGDQR